MHVATTTSKIGYTSEATIFFFTPVLTF